MSCCINRFDSNHAALNGANGLSIVFGTTATIALLAISIIALGPTLSVVTTFAAIGFGLKTFAIIGSVSSLLALITRILATVFSCKVIASENKERSERPNLQLLQTQYQNATQLLQSAQGAFAAATNQFNGAISALGTAITGTEKAEKALTRASIEKADLVKEVRAASAASREQPKEKEVVKESPYKNETKVEPTAKLPLSPLYSTTHTTAVSSSPTPLSTQPATRTATPHPLSSTAMITPVSSSTKEVGFKPVPYSPPDAHDGRLRSNSGRVTELADKFEKGGEKPKESPVDDTKKESKE